MLQAAFSSPKILRETSGLHPDLQDYFSWNVDKMTTEKRVVFLPYSVHLKPGDITDAHIVIYNRFLLLCGYLEITTLYPK